MRCVPATLAKKYVIELVEHAPQLQGQVGVLNVGEHKLTFRAPACKYSL